MTTERDDGVAVVSVGPADATRGVLRYRDLELRCALGRGGVREDKREGDGATPAGTWPLRALLYRPDRVAAPRTGLATRPLAPDDGWCDAPGDPNYNRRVSHPYPASAERLWRDDGLYDLVVILGHNDDPVVPGHGSAIFLHVARPGLAPTEGCIALAKADLVRLLEALPRVTAVRVTTGRPG